MILLAPWTTGDTYNAAIGQGNLEVTPLQLITAAAAVANNGDLYRPQLVKAITDSSGKVIQETQPELIRHLEIETYTWDVLPPAYKDMHLVEGVAREMEWVLDALVGHVYA